MYSAEELYLRKQENEKAAKKQRESLLRCEEQLYRGKWERIDHRTYIYKKAVKA